MTSATLHELDESDNLELLALAARCDTGSSAFRVDRAPDFFALPRYWGPTRYFGIRRSKRLIGCLGVTEQQRFIGGEPRSCSYLHDVRIDPEYRGSSALLRLVHGALRLHPVEGFYASILESNLRVDALASACGRALGGARWLGRSGHLGLPCVETTDDIAVREMQEPGWERCFRKLSKDVDFTPADPRLWREAPGSYLAAFRGDELCAVCKLVNGDRFRRIFAVAADGSRAHFEHGYLAFYAGLEAEAVSRALAAFARREGLPIVFRGLSAAQAQTWFRAGDVFITSRTLAAGALSRMATLQHHELVLL